MMALCIYIDNLMYGLKSNQTQENRETLMLRLLTLTLISLALLLGCSQSPLSKEIGEHARTHGKIDLAAITDFNWDVVLIFSPYTTNSSICQSIGNQWSNCKRLAPKQIAESDFHLVFMNHGSVVTQVTHSRDNGDFCRRTCALNIPKAEAIFYVEAHTSNPNTPNFYLLQKNSPELASKENRSTPTPNTSNI